MKHITTRRLKFDDDDGPYQEIFLCSFLHTLWYADGENETIVDLRGEYRLSELKELVQVMEAFDKKARKKAVKK